MISEALALSIAFSIPIFSTSELENLKPAVSFKTIGKPLKSRSVSIMSLVVPASLVTIDNFFAKDNLLENFFQHSAFLLM
jgi:hypothetical protein